MKKAYVKVKNNSAKSILKRPYIAAPIIGASLCAIVLSLGVPGADTKPEQQELAVTTSEPKPETEETVFAVPEKEAEEKTEDAPKEEVFVPNKTEVTMPGENELSLPSQSEISASEETAVSVGLFSGGGNIQLLKPVEGAVLNAYSDGKPVKSNTMGDWRVHTGIDLKAEQGQQVIAPADGKIIRAEKDSLTGYTVSIDHGEGVVSTIYNLEGIDKVIEGQSVKQGDVIGSVGNSASSELLEEPHIHFELKVNGEYVNPGDFLK